MVKTYINILLCTIRCRFRSGTREVHNKLEKNRRAHLKECFELLKKQVPASQDEKKTSNLSILRSAIRFIQVSRCSKKYMFIQFLINTFWYSLIYLVIIIIYIYYNG